MASPSPLTSNKSSFDQQGRTKWIPVSVVVKGQGSIQTEILINRMFSPNS